MTNRAVWVAIGLSLLLAIAGLTLWQPPPLDVATDPPAAAVAAAEGTAAEPGRAARTEAAQPSGVRAAAAAEFLLPTQLRLRVVDDRDGAPLPGATIWCADDDAREDALMRRPDEDQDALGDVFAILRRRGRTLTTNAAGEVDLPRGLHSTVVAGEHGALSGLDWLAETPPPRGYELRLRAQAPLEVEVFDHRGQPAPGVPLLLVRHRSADSTTNHRLGRTDRAGKLSAPLAGLTHGAGGTRALVGVVGVGLGRHAVECELDGQPRAPLRIELPPTGSIEVTLRDRVGIPLTAREVTVGLRSADARDAQFAGAAVPDREGRARVDWIALGLTLRVSAWAPELVSRDVPGPRREGEVVAVALGAEPNVCGLRGQIVADGAPIADTPFAVTLLLRLPDGKRQHVRGALRTDAAGRFSLPLAGRCLDAQGELHLRAAGSLRAPDARHARARLAAPVQRGGNDVGTLVLRPPVVCAAGVLVDELDRPVTRAGASFPDLDPAAVPVPPVLQVHDDGRFALLATDDAHPPHAELRAPGCLPQRIALGPHARDLRVVFARAHGLVIPVLVDPPGDGLGALHAELRGSDGERREGSFSEAASGLLLSFRDLRAATYELTVRLGGDATPLLATPVTVGASDPQLALDLRGRLRVASVRVMSDAGTPVSWAYVLLGEPVDVAGTPVWLGVRTDREGIARVATSSRRVAALVVASGMHEQRWAGPLEDRTLTLRRRELLLVSVPALAELATEAPVPAELRIVFAGRPPVTILANGARSATWPPRGRCDVTLGRGSLGDAQLGEYAATLIVTRRDGTRMEFPARGEPAVITADTQRLILQVDPAALAAAGR
jgi:hypothetical protein